MISKEMILQLMEKSIISLLEGRVKKVLLYGSQVRGDNTLESDIDCLLVVDNVDNRITDIIDDFAAAMLIKYRAVFSIIPVNENNFDERIYNPLFINANREGVVLWQKSA